MPYRNLTYDDKTRKRIAPAQLSHLTDDLETEPMRHSLVTKLAFCVLPALAIIVLLGSEAQARGRRGPSPAQIKAMQEQLKAQQEAEQKYQAAVQAKFKEVLDRYDLNKNGKIDGTEKPAYDKYLREVKLGKQADPILAIPYPKVEVKKSGSSTAAKK